jgi:hypothetical protein
MKAQGAAAAFSPRAALFGLDKIAIMPYKIGYHAEVVELVDTPVSGTGGRYACGGSSPPFGMFLNSVAAGKG